MLCVEHTLVWNGDVRIKDEERTQLYRLALPFAFFARQLDGGMKDRHEFCTHALYMAHTKHGRPCHATTSGLPYRFSKFRPTSTQTLAWVCGGRPYNTHRVELLDDEHLVLGLLGQEVPLRLQPDKRGHSDVLIFEAQYCNPG